MSVDAGFGMLGTLLALIFATNIWLIKRVISMDTYMRSCRYCKRSAAEATTGLDLHTATEGREG